MVTSAGSIGPAISRLEDAPPKVMVRLFAAADASASASSSGLRGEAAWRNPICAGLSISGKPLLYAVAGHSAKCNLGRRAYDSQQSGATNAGSSA